MSKDEDLKIGRQGSSRTRTFLEVKNTTSSVITSEVSQDETWSSISPQLALSRPSSCTEIFTSVLLKIEDDNTLSQAVRKSGYNSVPGYTVCTL